MTESERLLPFADELLDSCRFCAALFYVDTLMSLAVPAAATSLKPFRLIECGIDNATATINQVGYHASCHGGEGYAQVAMAERVDDARILWRGADDRQRIGE